MHVGIIFQPVGLALFDPNIQNNKPVMTVLGPRLVRLPSRLHMYSGLTSSVFYIYCMHYL